MERRVSWDPFNCLVCEVRDRDVVPGGTLAGLRYVAKDLFDVAGLPSGAGSPDFAAWRGPARADAWAIERLRAQGAEIVAKAQLHELAYGITGVNPHLGTPTNPRAPGRLPGGSSSGSAVAVAGGLVPFALGTDTGGSIRVPASFCGVYGFRPTWGYVPTDGVVALAPSFDTVGVLAADAGVLRRVAEALLRPATSPGESPFERVAVARDALECSSEEGRNAAEAIVRDLRVLGLPSREERLGVLDDARLTQRALQGAEAWAVHERWVTSARPRLGADVAALLEAGSRLGAAELGRASSARSAISLRVERLLGRGEVLVMPAAPGPAPALKDVEGGESALEVRKNLLNLTNLASLAGLPVVAIPAAPEGALPVGVQIIGPRGSDAALLELAARLRAPAGRAST